MGTAESSQSPELGGIGGFNEHSSFHRQSPNVARLIRSENSQKMEYEFPISDVNTSNLGHYSHHYHEPNNHTITTGNNNRHISSQQQQINPNDNLLSNRKNSSTENTSLWFSIASCFGCRSRDSNLSPMNPLRDKVHAIRIVRASNDLTPAVFDSHYNIITLEQLRECDNNGSGNLNDSTDLNNIDSNHNGNGSISSKKQHENSRRMRKKKKKQAAAAAYAARMMASDDDDGSERT